MSDSRLAVIGLGYVGLPLAISFVEAGLRVDGVDASATRVAQLAGGSSPIDDITDDRLVAALGSGLRVVAPEAAGLAEADVIFVCVPTPITKSKDPDLAPVLSAASMIREHLRAGQLVVLQSTTFPGTTTGPFRAGAGAVRPASPAPTSTSRSRRSGSTPATPRRASKTVPRLVGATTPAATKRAAALLRTDQRPRRCRCRRPMPPSWPSCSRTSSATSTSRS